LLVEDDKEVSALTRELLNELGFSVLQVASPDAALGALANARNIDVVLSDIMMPGGVSGVHLAREIRRRHPDLRVVLTTGYVHCGIASHCPASPTALNSVAPLLPWIRETATGRRGLPGPRTKTHNFR